MKPGYVYRNSTDKFRVIVTKVINDLVYYRYIKSPSETKQLVENGTEFETYDSEGEFPKYWILDESSRVAKILDNYEI